MPKWSKVMNYLLNRTTPQATRSRASRKLVVMAGGLLSLLAASGPAAAQYAAAPTTAPAIVADGAVKDGRLKLTANKTAVVNTRVPYKRVSVGQPDIADVNAIGPGTILVTAKKAGNTQLIIWDEQERSQAVDVTVEFDLESLRDQYKLMFPDAKIEVSAHNGAIALRGRVPSLQAAEQAVMLASPYSQKVLNLLDVAGGQQVMLQVRFAEVSRSAINNMGVRMTINGPSQTYTFNNGPGSSRDGGLLRREAVTVDSGVTAYGAANIGDYAFEAYVSALKNNNLLRVLAEPNLVAVSGQEASFLAGGEIPVPVPQSSSGGGTTITIEYKQFGVRLKFVPVVLGDGRVRLRVAPEVSDLDFSNAVTISGTVIPALNTRNVDTTVELGDGQTFGIAGLLNDRVQATRSATPYLGEIPILGSLFRSVRYERRETELLVLVTPRLVSPLDPGKVPTLPGQNWRHPSTEELFWGGDIGGDMKDEGKAGARQPAAPNGPPAKYRGQHGFTPATQPVAGSDR
jgi:pilus assembly protein CpaC